MTVIITIVLLAGVLAVVQRHRLELMAATVRGWALPCSVLGTSVQLLGMALGGTIGHLLVAAGSLALISAAATLRHVQGGRLLLLGIMLNGLAMAVHGRMPITPAVLQAVNYTAPVGAILSGSKDIVADGWIAAVLGDRFILGLPGNRFGAIFSLGDLLMIAGVLLAMMGPGRALPGTAVRGA